MMVCGTRRFQRRGHWGEFGMMGMRARFFGPGEVRLALLSLIADGPKHGYELMRQLEERWAESTAPALVPFIPPCNSSKTKA